MRKYLKHILTTFFILSLFNVVKAQDHVVGSGEKKPHAVAAYNYDFRSRSNNSQLMGYNMSLDTINVSSSSVVDGDSIVMLIGDVPAQITRISVLPDTGSSSDYYTSGTTDTVFVYSRINSTPVKIAYLADTTFTGKYTFDGTYISSESDLDSCLYYLKIPATKFSSGTDSYVVYYEYVILR